MQEMDVEWMNEWMNEWMSEWVCKVIVNPDGNSESMDSDDDVENCEYMDGCEMQRGKTIEK